MSAHDDPMSHVPPGSPWPLVATAGLTLVPFGVISFLGALKGSGWGPLSSHPMLGLLLMLAGGALFLFALMAWAHQIIVEKRLCHDLIASERDLKLFVALFLAGELMAFGAIFAYILHRNLGDPAFGPPHTPGFHLGGSLVITATIILVSSSFTCEAAHRCIHRGRIAAGRWLLIATIALGAVFLGFQGYEWGELIQRGFRPKAIEDSSVSAFAAIFYTSTGFHGLHVAIGLIMLFMVWLRVEAGHFQGKRQFSVIAASWYWHFVDVVWILLFTSLYFLS